VVKNHLMHFLFSSNCFLAISLTDSTYKTNGNTKMSELGSFISNSYRFLSRVLVISRIHEYIYSQTQVLFI
jgi:hypothetical protein